MIFPLALFTTAVAVKGLSIPEVRDTPASSTTLAYVGCVSDDSVPSLTSGSASTNAEARQSCAVGVSVMLPSRPPTESSTEYLSSTRRLTTCILQPRSTFLCMRKRGPVSKFWRDCLCRRQFGKLSWFWRSLREPFIMQSSRTSERANDILTGRLYFLSVHPFSMLSYLRLWGCTKFQHDLPFSINLSQHLHHRVPIHSPRIWRDQWPVCVRMFLLGWSGAGRAKFGLWFRYWSCISQGLSCNGRWQKWKV